MTGQREYYIGEIAKELQISQRTIRYYEELGFIEPNRTEGKFRVYAQSELDRLRIVLYLKKLEMSLDEISELLKNCSDGSSGGASSKLYEALKAKQTEIKTKIITYNDGLKEISGILSIIKRCERCSKPSEKKICDMCLSRRKIKLTPLIRTR